MNAGPLSAYPVISRAVSVIAAVVMVVTAMTALIRHVPTADRLELSDPRPSATPAGWDGMTVTDWTLRRGSGQADGVVRVGVVEPLAPVRADMLFIHGHSDRSDNHQALATAWSELGLRVILFDLPQHGGTNAGSLDSWEFDEIARLGVAIEQITRQDRGRPFLLGGFSFGGAIAVHSVVRPALLAEYGRRPAALTLFSPAVAVKPFSGGDGISRNRALVHPGGAVGAEPSPAVPAANPLFSGRLLAEGFADRRAAFPADIPLFVATGGEDEDTGGNGDE